MMLFFVKFLCCLPVFCLVFATGLDWFQTGLDSFYTIFIVSLKPALVEFRGSDIQYKRSGQPPSQHSYGQSRISFNINSYILGAEITHHWLLGLKLS